MASESKSYVCLTDEFVAVRKDQVVTVRNGKAYDSKNSELEVDVSYMLGEGREFFELIGSGDAPPPAVVRDNDDDDDAPPVVKKGMMKPKIKGMINPCDEPESPPEEVTPRTVKQSVKPQQRQEASVPSRGHASLPVDGEVMLVLESMAFPSMDDLKKYLQAGQAKGTRHCVAKRICRLKIKLTVEEDVDNE